MAPLGFPAAVIAAIRVCGFRWLKNAVGLATEDFDEVEKDLMSSTSTKVCELWNGQEIARMVKKPLIQELIYREGKPKDGNQFCKLNDAFYEHSELALLAKRFKVLNSCRGREPDQP
jgi:hypothetical protein